MGWVSAHQCDAGREKNHREPSLNFQVFLVLENQTKCFFTQTIGSLGGNMKHTP